MDSLDHYRKLIRQVLEENSYEAPMAAQGIETELVFDPTLDHFELIRTGWQDERRIAGSLIHIDIRNQKIYIQHDFTEPGVARQLVALGVPKNQIVLAFQPPIMRPLTEYAVM